jgi:hypothetical protein
MSSDEERHRENLRRWATTELVCYTIEDWDGERRLGSQSGFGSLNGEPIVASSGIYHRRSDGTSVEVVSHRQA